MGCLHSSKAAPARTREDKNRVDEEVQLGERTPPASLSGGTGERIALPPAKVGPKCVCVCVCVSV